MSKIPEFVLEDGHFLFDSGIYRIHFDDGYYAEIDTFANEVFIRFPEIRIRGKFDSLLRPGDMIPHVVELAQGVEHRFSCCDNIKEIDASGETVTLDGDIKGYISMEGMVFTKTIRVNGTIPAFDGMSIDGSFSIYADSPEELLSLEERIKAERGFYIAKL